MYVTAIWSFLKCTNPSFKKWILLLSLIQDILSFHEDNKGIYFKNTANSSAALGTQIVYV